MRYLWIPRLVERIQAAAAASPATTTTATTTHHINNNPDIFDGQVLPAGSNNGFGVAPVNPNFIPENSNTAASSDSIGAQVSGVSDLSSDYHNFQANSTSDFQVAQISSNTDCLTSPSGYFNQGLDFQAMEQNNMWLGGGEVYEDLWNVEDIWFSQQ